MKKASMALVAFSLGVWSVIGAGSEASAQYPGGGLPGHRKIPGHMRGRPLRVKPPMSSQPDEVMAARVVADASQGMSCERAGEMLRRLSNRILAASQESDRPMPPSPGRPLPGGPRPGFPGGRPPQGGPQEKVRWKNHLKSPLFWKEVWDRLAETYQSCESDCFDDGVAVGIMSAVGYCSASLELGGLSAPGALFQGKLPLCENSIFVGCQQGYSQGVAMTEGCRTYTEGVFRRVFLESQSQDCHIDDPVSL